MCEQCATEEHSQTPCESMPLIEAAIHIAPQLEMGMSEFRKLKSVSQSILDGNRQDETLRTVNEAESLLDHYVEELKKKLQRARVSLRPFSELSREERWKLKAVATKKIPNGPVLKENPDYHEAREMATRLQEVRKHTKIAKETLNALPNYVEVSISKEFLSSLKFDGNPIVISRKGQAEEIADDLDDSASSMTLTQETVYLIEKSSFSLEHCTEIVMMDEYIIASVGDSIQKRDRKRMSFRQAITLEGARQLCIIGETSEVSVLQKSGHITIIETLPNLTVLFRLVSDKHIVDISYLESTMGPYGCPEQSPVFVVCYAVNRESFLTEYVDLVQAKPTKYPGKPPTFAIDARTIAESAFSKNKSRFRGIWSVSAFQHRSIIVGASKGVTCLSKTGNLIWTIDIYQQVTQVMAYRTIIFVSVKDERKIITIGKQGHVIEENILPPMDLYPERMTAYKDTLMVKHRGQYKWIIFKKMYENAE